MVECSTSDPVSNRRSARSKTDMVGEVRGSHNVGGTVAKHAQARGLIVRPPGNLAVLSPPQNLTEDQIDGIAAILDESIEATMDDVSA